MSKKFNILIVDDMPHTIQVIGNILREHNYSFEFALNGKLALEWLEKKLFDLILLDIMMPEMDGFETCKKIRSDHKFDNTPIIFLSSQGDKQSIYDSLSMGGQDYISKPFDSRELILRIRIQLKLKAQQDELKNMNEKLGEMVKERTRQLKKTNVTLEEANKQLVNLDLAKSRFLRLISHEIRTPLNGISGFALLLHDELKETEYSNFVKALKVSADRLENFSLKALNYTKLVSDNYKLNMIDLDFKEMVNSNFISLLNSAAIKNISLINEIPKNRNKIVGDEVLINATINTILDNSIKFSKKSGTVRVNFNEDTNTFNYSFIDEGIGFPLKMLTEGIIMLEADERQSDLNFGIDLAISKLVMELHSGKLSIANNEGGGATVTLTFQK